MKFSRLLQYITPHEVTPLLARTPLTDPPVLNLDEATAMFDTHGKEDFIDGSSGLLEERTHTPAGERDAGEQDGENAGRQTVAGAPLSRKPVATWLYAEQRLFRI